MMSADLARAMCDTLWILVWAVALWNLFDCIGKAIKIFRR